MIKINYFMLILIYSPVLLLFCISQFKDKFETGNEALKLCVWPLSTVIVFIIFSLSWPVFLSIWCYTPISPFKCNDLSGEILSIFYAILILFSIIIYLKFIRNISIIEVFELKFTNLQFILKIILILTAINICSIYFLGDGLFVPKKDINELKIMDTRYIILFCFNTIILAPVFEEFLYRGLIYYPLYRKVGRWSAIILSSGIWSFTHCLYLDSLRLSLFIAMLLIGIFLTWLYDRSGSLMQPILFHSFKNSWFLYLLFKSL